MKKLFITLGLLTLCLSIGLAIFDATRELPEPSLTQPLKELLPTGVEFGWTSEDLPLGATEALEEASQRILNLTDFVYRRYTRGSDSFEVYIAYWAPGTMPARDMNGHVPDTCWVRNGWVITSKQVRAASEGKSIPGRWRSFSKNEAKIDVIFWHLLDKEPYQYGHKPFIKRLQQRLYEPVKHKLNMRQEQFLIRISSTESLDIVWNTNLIKIIFESMKFTGVTNENIHE